MNGQELENDDNSKVMKILEYERRWEYILEVK